MNYANSSVGYKIRSKRSRGLRRRAIALVGLFAVIAFALFAKLHSSAGSLPQAVVTCGRSSQILGEQALKNASCVAQNLRNPAKERSFAPAPGRPWTNADRNRLAGELHSAFAPAISGAQGWSLAVIGADGRTIFDDRAQSAVAPASVQKLIVAATALDDLGPAYRYHTVFSAGDAIPQNGALDGDLWLIGSGDPSLQSADLRNGIGMLKRLGLRRIDGSVIVDDTTLNGPALNPHWSTDDNGQDYAAPTSAISVDGDTIESSRDIGGVEQRVWTPMQDVARYVGQRVNGMLLQSGVPAQKPPAVGAAPLESVVLWDHRSAPLQTLESHMLYVSDNHYAEQLLRTVGEESTGSGNDAGGVAAEREFLARRGIPAPELRLYDGSGLSPQNRVAAITLTRLLYAEEPSLYLLLPRGGREGTLEYYPFTTALGRVRAKSGHLSDVSALAGYVATAGHGRVAFAFLFDGSPGDPDTAIVQAVDRLATF